VLVLAGQASPVQWLVTRTLMVTVIQHRYGSGGAMALVVGWVAVLVVVSVVVGEDGDFMDTLGGKSQSCLRR
jgi:hypothetical protein